MRSLVSGLSGRALRENSVRRSLSPGNCKILRRKLRAGRARQNALPHGFQKSARGDSQDPERRCAFFCLCQLPSTQHCIASPDHHHWRRCYSCARCVPQIELWPVRSRCKLVGRHVGQGLDWHIGCKNCCYFGKQGGLRHFSPSHTAATFTQGPGKGICTKFTATLLYMLGCLFQLQIFASPPLLQGPGRCYRARGPRRNRILTARCLKFRLLQNVY